MNLLVYFVKCVATLFNGTKIVNKLSTLNYIGRTFNKNRRGTSRAEERMVKIAFNGRGGL